MTRLSLCMIVRDEEERLGRCLSAAAPFVDEIVVVDTGSRDRSVEIARAHGARVVDFTWCDDFAAARNASVEAATGDWMLFLDADEVLSASAGRALRTVMNQRKVLGAYIPLRDEGEGSTQAVSLLFRAVRRRPDIRWHYRLHEQLLPDAIRCAHAEGLRFATLDGEIVHDGYSTAVFESRGKHERNLRIFEAQLADTPDDPFVLYKFGDFLRRDPATFPRAMQLLERAWRALQDLPVQQCRELTYAGEVCALLALGVLRAGAVERAGRFLDFAAKNCRATGHVAYARGQWCLANADGAGALTAFREASACAGQAALIPATQRVSRVLAPAGAARALLLLGRNAEALTTARGALAAGPMDADAVSVTADAALATGDLRGAIACVTTALSAAPQQGELWLCGGQVLFRARMFAKAAEWAERSVRLLPRNGPAAALLGECLLQQDQPAAARLAFELCADDPRCAAGLQVLRELEGSTESPLLSPQSAAERTRMLANLQRALA